MTSVGVDSPVRAVGVGGAASDVYTFRTAPTPISRPSRMVARFFDCRSAARMVIVPPTLPS